MDSNFHSLLSRQLKKYFGDQTSFPKNLSDFIEAINSAYKEFDDDREMLERSLELSSQELLEANSQMRAIFLAIPDLVFRLNNVGTIIDYKGGNTEDFLALPKSLIGKKIYDIRDEKISNLFLAAFNQVKKTNSLVNIEYLVKTKNQEKYYEARMLPLLEDQMIVIIRNITERKHTEAALKKSEDLYRTIFENSGTSLIFIEADLTISLVNKQSEKLFGYSKEEIEGKISFKKLVAFKDDLEKLISYHKKRLIDPALAPSTFEFKLTDKFGNIKDIFLSVVIQPGTSKSLAALIDVSEKTKAELALLRSEEQYRFLYDENPSMYFTVDPDGIILSVNNFGCQQLGYNLSELLKHSIYEIIYSDFREFIKDNLKKCIFNLGIIFNWEIQKVRKDGSMLWVEETARALRNSNGELIVFIVCEDITNKKNLEIEIEKALEKSKESDKLKSVLLANMSHELRTPLNGILGLTSLLLESCSNENIFSMLKKIYYSSERLLKTFDSVLNLSQIESGTLPLNFAEVSVVPLTKNILKEYSKLAAEKNLAFNIENRADGIICLLDEQIYVKALKNIIDNAFKFTNQGEIRIILDSQYLNSRKNFVIKIIDTGIGIEEGFSDSIFKEFKQISEGYNRKYEGLGLGLTIANKMVKLMNGALQIESKINEGTIVSMSFYEIENKSAQVFSSIIEEEKIIITDELNSEILLVEDNSVNVEVIQRFLKNYKIDFVSNGIDALVQVSQKKYSLILLDINLGSELTGIEILAKIKVIKEYENVPVIAITGYAMLDDKYKFLAEGFTDYLSKPFSREELLTIVKKVLKQ